VTFNGELSFTGVDDDAMDTEEAGEAIVGGIGGFSSFFGPPNVNIFASGFGNGGFGGFGGGGGFGGFRRRLDDDNTVTIQFQVLATITCYSGSVNEALDNGELDDKFSEMVGDIKEATSSGELFDRIAAIAQENGAGEFATGINYYASVFPEEYTVGDNDDGVMAFGLFAAAAGLGLVFFAFYAIIGGLRVSRN